SGAGLDTGSQLAKALAGARACRVKALDLGGDPFVGYDAMPDIRYLPAQEIHVADHDARRGGYAPDLTFHYRSPNLLAISAAMASIACSASSPSARSWIDAPHSAASIITPMMLFPFTSVASR